MRLNFSWFVARDGKQTEGEQRTRGLAQAECLRAVSGVLLADVFVCSFPKQLLKKKARQGTIGIVKVEKTMRVHFLC